MEKLLKQIKNIIYNNAVEKLDFSEIKGVKNKRKLIEEVNKIIEEYINKFSPYKNEQMQALASVDIKTNIDNVLEYIDSDEFILLMYDAQLFALKYELNLVKGKSIINKKNTKMLNDVIRNTQIEKSIKKVYIELKELKSKYTHFEDYEKRKSILNYRLEILLLQLEQSNLLNIYSMKNMDNEISKEKGEGIIYSDSSIKDTQNMCSLKRNEIDLKLNEYSFFQGLITESEYVETQEELLEERKILEGNDLNKSKSM